jgi:hypothetical protein
MHYLIYKITNRLNNKFYVGKHKTENKEDNYFGSGLLIKRAIEKHGRKHFIKEILFECKNEEEMNQMEIDIVDEDFVARDDTYNVDLGGQGGHTFTEEQRKRGHDALRKRLATDDQFRREFSRKRSIAAYVRNAKYGFGSPKGRVVSEETRRKMSASGKGKRSGKNNGVYGKHWVTDGQENKMVENTIIPDGWRKGRTL